MIEKIETKLKFFKRGAHKHIDEYFSNWDKKVYDEEHYNKFRNLDILEFIYTPKIRLSEKPDPTRKVLLFDDYTFGGNTLRSSLLDLLRLGYKEIKWSNKIYNPGISFCFGDNVTEESRIFGIKASELYSNMYKR